MIAWQNIINSVVHHQPFTWFECNQCLTDQSIRTLLQAFPVISSTGSHTSESLHIQPTFNHFLQVVQSPKMEQILSEKLKIPLTNLHQTLTFRGYSKLSDGSPHLDSSKKVVTMLIYMNDNIASDDSSGQLRLLNSHSLTDYFAEIAPKVGKMVVFKCTTNSWHGHLPFEGKRQVIQINWVRSKLYVSATKARHRISAFFKPKI